MPTRKSSPAKKSAPRRKSAPDKPTPRKIIILCDGTGNAIKENQSNVLKFYRLLQRNDDQIVYYDTGVGTITDSTGAMSQAWLEFKRIWGLATGFGLFANVLDAYRFLSRYYHDGDEVYMLGFSRGAYTVRVLAGFNETIGLLAPHQLHLSDYVLRAYQQVARTGDFMIARRIRETLDTSRIPIRFVGCWDTVASVFAPGVGPLGLPGPLTLPYTRSNPSVKTFRHALAIDERRRMYRANHWQEPQVYKSNPFAPKDKEQPQDIKQVWFAGVHADIGGGYPEAESAPAKFPLDWMVKEAKAQGLKFRPRLYKRLVLGQNVKNSTRNYVAPDPAAPLRNSLRGFWWLLEVLPKRTRYREWPDRPSFLGFYVPLGEPRQIASDSNIDPSVRERQDKTDYDPINLPG
jgi:uncharacterized protein (DUF2235 family)